MAVSSVFSHSQSWLLSRQRRFRPEYHRRAILILIALLFACGCGKHAWNYTLHTPPPPPTENFDVSFDANDLDPNHAPRNVDWKPQLQGNLPDPDACPNKEPYGSACTKDVIFKDKPGIKDFICFFGNPSGSFRGHADWLVAQYNGSVGWFNLGADSDYDLVLVPETRAPGTENRHGVTTNNNFLADDSHRPRYIEMEWDSEETDDAFTSNPLGFWANFARAARSDNAQTEVSELLHPSNPGTLACGTALGLFGLDCDHGCRSELHPIYALAVQTAEDPNDNEWAVFVRNWGTGGFCSQYNDELAEASLSLVLPYSSSQPPDQVEIQDFATTTASGQGAQCPKVYFQDGKTILNVALPPAESRAVASFTLKIKWPQGANAASCAQVNTPKEAPLLVLSKAAHPADPSKMQAEDYMGALLREANHGRLPDFRKGILPAVGKTAMPNALLRLQVRPSTPACSGKLEIVSGAPPAVSPIKAKALSKDAPKRARDDAKLRYLCQSYHAGKISTTAETKPRLDKACKNMK